ncbi:hypothetical protein [Aquimarina algiphila]|uniref:hypothetical protein n=1 Tax=Aquimarina algiphila TaxID=2047982 RepID=UPI00232C2275|nr:hypothetical protein [Aquimarina algiphila]
MILIWKGRGILTVLVLAATFFILLFALSNDYAQYGFALPLIVSGLFSIVLGHKWNSSPKPSIDPKTGEQIVLRNQHTIFWMNMEYWGFLLLILGITFFTQEAVFTWSIGGGVLLCYIIYRFKKKKEMLLFKEEQSNIKETLLQKKEPEYRRNYSTEEEKVKEDPSRFMPK